MIDKTIIYKLRLDIILLCIRVCTIILWISILWLSIEIDLLLQIIFMLIIFVSDALDGIISRRFCLPLQQYKFRILDALVDKMGILGFLLTLFCLRRISYMTLSVIIGYDLLLVIFPIVYIIKGFKKVRNV